MKKKGLIFLLLAAPVLAWGQTTVTPDRPRSRHGDCVDPIELIPGREYVHGESPSGPGRVQEFNGNQGACHFSPAEINTVWYSFRAPADALIVFEITPFRIQDDDDWRLFRQEDPASSDSIFEYVLAESPSGPGRVQEFNGNQGASHFFPAEINTVWYSFRAPADGLIVFEITPFRIQDDYDWMLFRQEDPASCDSIFEYGIKPIR